MTNYKEEFINYLNQKISLYNDENVLEFYKTFSFKNVKFCGLVDKKRTIKSYNKEHEINELEDFKIVLMNDLTQDKIIASLITYIKDDKVHRKTTMILNEEYNKRDYRTTRYLND